MTIVPGGSRQNSTIRKRPNIRAGRVGLIVVVCLFAPTSIALTSIANGAERPSLAEQFLREQRGLVPIGRGQVWISDLERRVRRRLGQMQKLETHIRSAQRALGERVDQNRRLWLAQRARVQRIQQTLRGLSSSDRLRARLESELRVLRAQASPPEQLGGQRDVQTRLIRLINDRNALAISLFWIRRGDQRLRAQYDQLADDFEVRDALETLGGQHQLGPDKDYTKQTRKFEPFVLTDGGPLYRQSGRLRFCLLADDRTPLTFSWRDDTGPTLVPLSMLERMGLTIPTDAPRVEHRVGSRRFMTWRVSLPPLRLGRYVLRGVEAYVLPSEGEDLGAMLGRAAFGDTTVRVEPDQLRIALGDAN